MKSNTSANRSEYSPRQSREAQYKWNHKAVKNLGIKATLGALGVGAIAWLNPFYNGPSQEQLAHDKNVPVEITPSVPNIQSAVDVVDPNIGRDNPAVVAYVEHENGNSATVHLGQVLNIPKDGTPKK